VEVRDGVDGPATVRFRSAWEGTVSLPSAGSGDGVRAGLDTVRVSPDSWMNQPVPLDRCLPGNGFLCLGDLLVDPAQRPPRTLVAVPPLGPS